MATDEISVLIRAIGARQAAKDVSLFANSLTNLDILGKKYGRRAGLDRALTKEETAGILGLKGSDWATGRVETSAKNLNKEIQRTRKGLIGFRMEWLSVMFFGQMVWRQYTTFFKDLIKTYQDLDRKGNLPLTRALTKLSATFTYLKFQILDAMGPMLTQFLLMLANALMWFADIDPGWLSAIAWGVTLLAIALGVLAAVATWTLFINGLTDLGVLATTGKLAKVATGIKSISWAVWTLDMALLAVGVTSLIDQFLIGLGALIAFFAKPLPLLILVAGWAYFTWRAATGKDNTFWGWMKAYGWAIALGTIGGWAVGSVLLPGVGGPAGAMIGITITVGITFVIQMISWAIDNMIKVTASSDVLKNLPMFKALGIDKLEVPVDVKVPVTLQPTLQNPGFSIPQFVNQTIGSGGISNKSIANATSMPLSSEFDFTDYNKEFKEYEERLAELKKVREEYNNDSGFIDKVQLYPDKEEDYGYLDSITQSMIDMTGFSDDFKKKWEEINSQVDVSKLSLDGDKDSVAYALTNVNNKTSMIVQDMQEFEDLASRPVTKTVTIQYIYKGKKEDSGPTVNNSSIGSSSSIKSFASGNISANVIKGAQISTQYA